MAECKPQNMEHRYALWRESARGAEVMKGGEKGKIRAAQLPTAAHTHTHPLISKNNKIQICKDAAYRSAVAVPAGRAAFMREPHQPFSSPRVPPTDLQTL